MEHESSFSQVLATCPYPEQKLVTVKYKFFPPASWRTPG